MSQKTQTKKASTPDRRAATKRGNGRSRTEEEPAVHAHRTAKVVELVASSTKSFEDAVEHAIEDASSTTRGITGAQVHNFSVKCKDGKIVEYRVNLDVAFGIERTPRA